MFSARSIIILLIIVLLIGGIAFLSFKRSNAPIITPSPAPTESSDITIVESVPELESSEVHSPDGKMELIMEVVTEGEDSTYSFFVSDIPETDRNLIFEKTAPAGSVMGMSSNAWSPDNKYFFIKEESAGSVDYLVFKASGEDFSEDEQYIRVASLFAARDTGYSFSEATGWDSETLLHVYTTKADGTRGPSYWFEVPSYAIIQLASH